MTPFLYRLGQLCARRRLVVLGLWLVVAIVLGTLAKQAGTQTTDNVTLPGTDSQRATNILEDHFGSAVSYGTNPIVLAAPQGAKLTDPSYRAAVEQVAKQYAKDPGVVAVVDPLTPAGRAQLSSDERIGFLSLELRDSPAALTADESQHLLALADAARAAGLRVAAGGYLGQDLSQPGSANSEGLGLLAAVVVLLMTFGTVVAMGMPILVAIFGLGTGLSLIALLSQLVQVPSAAPALATMIGLGVGIDYSLFIVTRHRQQRAEGMELRESVARAAATAGGAVVFAGATVTIALCSLLLARIPIVTQLGYVSAVAVLVAVLAAITLLPAALSLVGARIDALKVPGLRARHDARPHGWMRWARGVAAHPWPALVVALLVILVLAFPVRHLSLGQSDTGQLPTDTTARQAYDLLSEGFGPGFNGSLLVAVEIVPPAHAAARSGSAAEAQLAALGAAMARAPGVAAVSPPLPARDGRAALFTVTPTTAPSAAQTATLVRELRDTTVPDATRGTALVAYVGGTTAGFIDLADGIGKRLPLVIAVVLGLSFLLLLVAFRSVPVALKAVLMNLLSIGAAFGIVTYVFTHSWSSDLIGVDGTSPIVSFVPLMMFAILFGLSMDYEVFLMTHVRERWRATGDAHRAVVEGLAGTARVITSAALIMVAVFCAFLLNGSPAIKQFGLGMAAAVAVDATVIRCLLVPALLALLGRRAWWMPRWLARATPPLSIEGEAWFEGRAATAATATTDAR
ncbi:MAG TPA: MMPL family transporter [Conexibacter sp.]|jgi:RND superfamily putative drug exporter|nr:MMPL family transporter [Conexibacter sp.]